MTTTARKQAIRALLYLAVIGLSYLAGVLLNRSSIGNFVELRAYDLRFLARGPVARDRAAPLTIVGIDEESFRAIPDPLIVWNGYMGAVVEGLAEAGARVAGIDFLFADTSRLDPDGQQALASQLLRIGPQTMPVVLAREGRSAGGNDPLTAIYMAAIANGHPFGYVNLTTDPDDFVRRQRLRDDTGQPSFAMAVAQAFAEKENLQLDSSRSEVLIDYRERESLRVVSFARALDASRKHDTAFLRDNFSGRIVLIARYSQAGGEDLHATPYYYWRNNPTGTGRRTPGVVIHANTIGTLISGKFVEPLGNFSQTAITLALIAAIALACALCRPAVAFIISGVLLAGFLYYALILSFRSGAWVMIVAPVFGSIVSTGLAETVNYVLEGREKRRIRNLFKRYVKDEVIQQILQNPDELILHGERKHIAVLFADVKGFTTRSEAATAEEIVSLLNVYFKEVVGAIHVNRGMVSLLMGDGLMSIFGAPLEDADATLHAVQAGIAMREALDRVNQKLQTMSMEPIDIGIGIHCGEAIVGNMGSPDMMEYTAIGDVVNTAARLEGVTRKVEAGIVISEAAYESLNGRIPGEFVGEFDLKGKMVRLRVYKVG